MTSRAAAALLPVGKQREGRMQARGGDSMEVCDAVTGDNDSRRSRDAVQAARPPVTAILNRDEPSRAERPDSL